jgi:ADP-L-glycero-D-manno-heptose 6-epimerase
MLVSGAAGLIGGATIRELNKRGITNILAVDKLGSCPHKWRNLAQCHIADYIEYDDLRLDDLPASIDTVVHCGARSHTTETDAAFLIRNNYRFSQDLARWCKAHGARFVYASSAATYGADTVMDDTAPIDNLRPLNPYGLSKQLFDQWMTHEGWLDEKWAVGLKYTNVFGPLERHKGEQRSLVCKAYDSLRAGKPIELYESARPDVETEEIARDFIYVEDAAKVTVWFALDEQGRKAHGLFNVGSGVATSFRDLAWNTADAARTAHPDLSVGQYQAGYKYVDNKPVYKPDWRTGDLDFPWITYAPMPEQLRARYQYRTNPPIAKLRAAGYTEPFKSVEEGVREYVGEWLAKEES